MMRYTLIGILFGASLALTECATSGSAKHHQQKNKKTFKTSLIQSSFSLAEGDMGNKAPIMYQVQIHCKNANCESQKITLTFSIEPGFNTVYLSKRSLRIHAGDKKYHWSNQEWHNIHNAPPANGQIISVHLKKSELKQIAESKKVTGVLAGISFTWSYGNRNPIRSLLAKFKKNQ